jgi:pyruvate dehydrogenase E1 component
MYVDEEDVFYYITLQNENYQMPAKPKGADQGILKGLYLFEKAARKKKRHVQLFGSGTIMNAVLKARDMLSDYGVSADVWSATSYQLLRREALSCERWNRLHPTDTPRVPWVSSVTKGAKGPFIAASDYVKALPDGIGRWLPNRLVPLGTDGYGMSDTREALRRHFEVDAESIVLGALDALRQDGGLDGKEMADAIAKLGLDPEKKEPFDV